MIQLYILFPTKAKICYSEDCSSFLSIFFIHSSIKLSSPPFDVAITDIALVVVCRQTVQICLLVLQQTNTVTEYRSYRVKDTF